jgi:hypothetical protein
VPNVLRQEALAVSSELGKGDAVGCTRITIELVQRKHLDERYLRVIAERAAEVAFF